MDTRHNQLGAEALGDHIDRLSRAARCLCGSCQEAEELVKETFARVVKKPRRLGAEDDLPHLLRVPRNTFIARAGAGRPQTLPQSDAVELVEAATVPPLEHQRDPGHVYRAIAALPPDLRDAVAAVEVVGLSRQRTLPFLRRMHGRYRPGLVLVGVHTPELPIERPARNVERAARERGLEFRVGLDNDYAAGHVRYAYLGGGGYRRTEATIGALLAKPSGRANRLNRIRSPCGRRSI